ncbi:ATP-binding cassette domain-containing protein [Ideonella sp. 4Y11]|uniref:ATP-binding cassette domain-containing protein n=1 Tax=Ideonella aquatica TaxID=2824119 RepID=A0A940YLU2_9BURK|nr:ATP-binding cassette domain-containing protein [Ideonella aquatica]MBQ0960259.1 ATP-binding cassette domain-containing protein [Ideonella aquatica]
MSGPVLSFDGVRFAYPGEATDTLDLPALALAVGERVLLRGDSGCGKSTLLSLAAGVLLPRAGRVALLGQDWQALRPGARDARRVDHVGYLFQQFNLLPYLSVLDNVLLPCRFSARRAQRARAHHASERAAAQALLQALGLEAALWPRPATALSVGQQQRVAAARALIGEPELVIADEPTSALDEGRRDAFMRLLIAQCERVGSALLFVSHDQRLAQHFVRVLDLPAINRAGHAALPS